MDPVSLATTLGIVAGGLIAFGVILKTLFTVYRFFRSLDDASQIIKVLPDWQTKVNSAMKELVPNSGTSLKDQVTGVGSRLDESHKKILETAEAIIEANQKALETDRKLDALGANVDNLGHQVDNLGRQVDTLGNNLEEIRNEIRAHIADDHAHGQ